MSIRERQLGSLVYSSGNTSRFQIPRDAVFHALRLSVVGGTFSTVQGVSGTGPSLVPGFPFSLIRQVRVVRNGSDYVIAMSGEQAAKQHYYLNRTHPQARLYTTSSNVETLRTASVRGLTVPATAQGIGENQATFAVPNAPSSTGSLSFDCQFDLMFQTGVDDDFFATCVDGRPLADFAIEIDWATEAAQIAAAGTANTSSSASFTANLLSLDQDNVADGLAFGTFKRSQQSYSNFQYGSGNNQVLLPRGNMLYSLLFATRAFKTGSSVNPVAENSVLGNMSLRVNTNFYLKTLSFQQFQAANIADHGGRQNAWATAQGSPQGWADVPLTNATQELRESLPTYAFDQLDIQLSLQDITAATNGATTSSTQPQIDILISEVIPGVSVASNAPQGAQAGSISRTSAKPYSR